MLIVLLLLFVVPGWRNPACRRSWFSNMQLDRWRLPQPQLKQLLRCVTVRLPQLGIPIPRIGAGTKVIDLGGLWLLPGLIDVTRTLLRCGRSNSAHVRHYDRPSYGSSKLRGRWSSELRRSGMVDLPDVIACVIRSDRIWASRFFLDFPDLFLLMPKFVGTDNIRRIVRANLERGVNWIKILATERAGTPDTTLSRDI